MKMVKSLLLGGAAGLVAVGGAQAADLPVKAKPVEYVKVCSLYGEGFFYIPGTDTCLKIGGWVRFDQYGPNTQGSGQPDNSGGAGRNDRLDTADYSQRARFQVSTDVRTQTEYGTLRAYIRMGFEFTTGTADRGQLYVERGFIQFAGFTLGKTQSFFDIWAHAWSYGAFAMAGGSDTAGQGTLAAMYTAALGNGFSASIGVEDTDSRRTALWEATATVAASGGGTGNPSSTALAIGNFPGPLGLTYTTPSDCQINLTAGDNTNGNANTTGGLAVTGCPTGNYAAASIPDIVGVLRVDQAWGSAQLSGALHEVRGGFYGNDFITQAGNSTGNNYTGVYPSDAWGWAVAAGIVWNLPWNPGDKFWVEGAYDVGAAAYVGFDPAQGQAGFYDRFDGAKVAAGWALDGVYTNNAMFPFSGIQLSTSWDVAAAIEHYWTPSLRTSLYGQYSHWTPGSQGNAIMCNSKGSPAVSTATGATGNGTVTNVGTVLPGCDFSFNIWSVGTRTIWNPVKNLDVGLDIMYSEIDQNMNPALILMSFAGAGGRAAGFYTPSNEGIVSGLVRVQRNFWP
ncbi:MAG TPA: porin [Xanthobacteraceae bacterium]|nr:porin [Xanthobacteraceae bacterium]